MSRVPPDRPVAPRPAAGRARSCRTPVLSRALAWSLAIVLAGCAPTVPPPSASPGATASPGPLASGSQAPSEGPGSTERPGPTARVDATPVSPTRAPAGPDLLLLAFDAAAASLALVRPSGTIVPIPLPDRSVAAVVPLGGDRLVAVLRDGRAFVARRGPEGIASGTGWRALALRGAGEPPPGAYVWSATTSPDGTRIAAIARPGDAQSPSALVAIDPVHGLRAVHRLGDQAEGVPPAWVDGERVAIVQRDRLDRLFIGLIATVDGRILDRLPVRAQGFATSGDGRTSIALADERVVVGPTASILALRHLPEAGPALAPGDRVSGGFSLSRDGRFLAVVVQDGEAGPSTLAIYEQVGATWRAEQRIALPDGSSGGWPTWLP